LTAFTYIAAGLLCLGWIVLLILSMSYQFADDEQDELHLRSLPKTNPNNSSETDTPG
jgi:hypothetical protein